MVGSSRFVHHRKEVPEELVPLNTRVKVNVNPVSVYVGVCVCERGENFISTKVFSFCWLFKP